MLALEVTSHTSSDMSDPPPQKRKPPRCKFPGCKKRVGLLSGVCKWCGMHVCQAHRIPEAHQCAHLQDCRRAAFESNQSKNSTQCCPDKLAAI